MIIHNPILTGSFTFNGTDVSSVTGSSTFSASFASSINSLNAATASLNSFTASTNTFTASAATTGSNTFVGNQVVTGSLNVSGSITTPGTLTAQTLVVQTITSSVDFVTGSTRFGSLSSNTHVFTGSVSISGSATTALNVNAGALFVSSSGNVGIGTTNPLYKLDVQGGIANFSGTVNISTGNRLQWNGGDIAIVNTGSYDMAFLTYTGAALTEKMRIISNGNVGIGTQSNLSQRLTILDNNDAEGLGVYRNFSAGTDSGTYVRLGALNGSSVPTPGVALLGVLEGGKTSGYLSILVYTGSSPVERMRISNNGNVGIGTATPDNTYQGLTIYGSNPSLRLKGSGASSWTWIEFVTSAGTNNFSMGVNQTQPYFGIKAGAGMDSPSFAINLSGSVGIGTNTPSTKLHISSTDAIVIPVGTTAQRPASAPTGSFRYNSSLAVTEYYDGTNWYQNIPEGLGTGYAVEYLVVAGGGGGGAGFGNGNAIGGGGAGGMITGSSFSLVSGNTYYVLVGAGGAGGTGTGGQSSSNQGNSGGNSSIGSGLIAVGGGGGSATGYAAKSGGSGGGGYIQSDKGYSTLGQGNDGGVGYEIDLPFRGGGGGGKGAAGASGQSSGNGGNGMVSTISGSVTFAGGGGGGGYTAAGSGGTGGGGAGGYRDSLPGTAGTTNTGGGGGGGGWPASGTGGSGGNGGSGIVIIKYPGSQRGSGGTVESIGGYVLHKFTSSGVFVA